MLIIANVVDSMLFQLLLIHLFRPFLKYTKSNTSLPAHISPRKICTQAASAISELLRMYKRSYGFRQISHIAVYIAHTACTIHLLNLPDETAQSDVVHGLKHLEDMAEGWLCARRTLRILDISANTWQVKLPSEAATVFERTHSKWGSWGSWDQATFPSTSHDSSLPNSIQAISGTRPDRNSTPEGRLSPALRTDPSLSNIGPLTDASIDNVPGLDSSAVPPSFLSHQPAYQSVGIPLQHPELAPPEPTYLRPISQTGYQFPLMYSPAPPGSSSHSSNPWYVAPSTQIYPPTPLALSHTAGGDGAEGLVEGSQDWCTRNATAMDIGMRQWGDGWNPALAGQLPQFQYDERGGHDLGPTSQPP